MTRYIPVDSAAVPPNLRWDVPPQNQGQIVEVAYADIGGDAAESSHGADYQRVTDRSDQSVAYYARENIALRAELRQLQRLDLLDDAAARDGGVGAFEADADESVHGYSFAEWLAAAGRSDSTSEYDLRAAWRAGEDPSEYAIGGES